MFLSCFPGMNGGCSSSQCVSFLEGENVVLRPMKRRFLLAGQRYHSAEVVVKFWRYYFVAMCENMGGFHISIFQLFFCLPHPEILFFYNRLTKILIEILKFWNVCLFLNVYVTLDGWYNLPSKVQLWFFMKKIAQILDNRLCRVVLLWCSFSLFLFILKRLH